MAPLKYFGCIQEIQQIFFVFQHVYSFEMKSSHHEPLKKQKRFRQITYYAIGVFCSAVYFRHFWWVFIPRFRAVGALIARYVIRRNLPSRLAQINFWKTQKCTVPLFLKKKNRSGQCLIQGFSRGVKYSFMVTATRLIPFQRNLANYIIHFMTP